MKNLILKVFLVVLGLTINGCALVSPFKSIDSCKGVLKNGNCETIESNLGYAIATDNVTITKQEIVYDENEVEKSELTRILMEYDIDKETAKKPVMIPPSTYRVLVLPYTDGTKYYSGRYIYITAGKVRWVTGGLVVGGSTNIKVNLPETSRKKAVVSKSEISNIKFGRGEPVNITPKKEEPATKLKPVKHRVSAYLLNCRTLPGMDGTAIAVFEQDKILDVIDKSLNWWLVNYYDQECYVNSSYLYAEPEQ